MKKYLNLIFILVSFPAAANSLPLDFVYLKAIDPSIQQEIRYFTNHNFIGSPIEGYQASECILTKAAAQALSAIQKELQKSGLSLKVYDCYRPQRAVNEFIAWSQKTEDQKMKAEFYPRVNKADFFELGYVGAKSGHTRGSTMDLTIIPAGAKSQTYRPNQPLVACYAPYNQRFNDGSIDMGTGFDCMDPLSHNDNQTINPVAYKNRQLLKTMMEKHGFLPFQTEWWHFTLKNEPHPDSYFDFPVTSL